MSKTLIIRENLWQESVQLLMETYSELDLLTFESIGELPLNYTSEIYSRLFFLVNKINADLLGYVKNVRILNNSQTIFIIGNVVNKELYSQIAQIEDLFVFEKSPFAEEQVLQLFEQQRNMSQNAVLMQDRLKRTKELISYSPEAILTIDGKGFILNVNKATTEIFQYEERDLLSININNFIPGYSYEDFLSLVLNHTDKKELITTFVNKDRQIKPVRITIVRAPHILNEFFVYITNRSEVLTYKRILEYQNRCFADLRILFDQFFVKSKLSENSSEYGEQIRRIFNCDLIIRCPITSSRYKGKLEINKTALSSDEQDIVAALGGILESVIKQPEINVLQFFEENTSHADIVQFAKTVTFIPIATDRLNEIILVLYLNHYEPDGFIYDIYKILQDVIGFAYTHNRKLAKFNEDKKFRKMVDSALDGIYRTTISGQLIYANPAFYNMLGINKKQLALDSNNIAKYYVKQSDRDAFIDTIKSTKVVHNYITKIKKESGELFTVVEHAHYINKKNGEEYIEGIIRDISQNKQLETSLEDSRLFANQIIDQAGVMITVTLENGEYIIWNKKAEEVTGYKKEEIVGRQNVPVLLYPDEKYRTYVEHQLLEHLAERSSVPVEVTLNSKMHGEKVVNWTSIKLNTQTYPNSIVSFGIDNTEMRQLERRFNESQKMAVFNSVTDKIAQQFLLFIERIGNNLEQIGKEPEKESKTAKNKAEFYLREAHQFSDQVLNLSGKQLSKQIDTIDPNEIIEHSVHILKNTIPSNISIRYKLNSQGYIKTNEAQLNQIMLNLALNSVAAMPDGGEISIITEVAETVNDRFLQQNNVVNKKYLKVIFSDTGKGMSSADLERLFEPFFTTSSDMNRKGLGATLIFNIVRAANGYLAVDSQLDMGTTVTLYLPFIHESKDYKVHQESRQRILIVDDQKVIREFLNDMAGIDGYKTLLAKDGVEGLKLFKKHHENISLAILDIVMPKMNGNELYYEIKKINPDIKVLITSGHTNKNIKQKLLHDGVDGFLPKPFDVQSARDQIRALLN